MRGLTIMILGLAIFLGVHLFTIMRGQRAALVARLGENGYKALYSLASLVGLVLIVYGYQHYRQGEWIDLWFPPVWLRHVAALLVLPAVILIVAAYVRGNIYLKLKHPMLAGVKLWALAHLLANGDLGSIILFGSVLVWAVIDRISLKRRADPGAPPIPVGGTRNDVIAIAGGTALYLVLGLWFHPYVIGVPVFGA
jgi:uncharacterized membrane protein